MSEQVKILRGKQFETLVAKLEKTKKDWVPWVDQAMRSSAVALIETGDITRARRVIAAAGDEYKNGASRWLETYACVVFKEKKFELSKVKRDKCGTDPTEDGRMTITDEAMEAILAAKSWHQMAGAAEYKGLDAGRLLRSVVKQIENTLAGEHVDDTKVVIPADCVKDIDALATKVEAQCAALKADRDASVAA